MVVLKQIHKKWWLDFIINWALWIGDDFASQNLKSALEEELAKFFKTTGRALIGSSTLKTISRDQLTRSQKGKTFDDLLSLLEAVLAESSKPSTRVTTKLFLLACHCSTSKVEQSFSFLEMFSGGRKGRTKETNLRRRSSANQNFGPVFIAFNKATVIKLYW